MQNSIISSFKFIESEQHENIEQSSVSNPNVNTNNLEPNLQQTNSEIQNPQNNNSKEGQLFMMTSLIYNRFNKQYYASWANFTYKRNFSRWKNFKWNYQ